METPIHTFQANTFQANLITIIFALTSVAIIWWLYRYNKKELPYDARKRRGMYNMLLFTVVLLTSSTAILNFWNSLKLQPVKIYSDSIELPNAKIPFQNIAKIYIYTHRPTTIASPPADSLMNYDHSLFIEEFDRTKPMHILAEEDYPIEEIFEKLRAVREEK